MAWAYLLLVGVLEVVWAFTMKQSDGFTRLLPTPITLVAMIGSFALLSVSMRTLPLGTAYTVWTGIGAVGASLVGILVLGEVVSPTRIAAAGLIVSGLLLMKSSKLRDCRPRARLSRSHVRNLERLRTAACHAELLP